MTFDFDENEPSVDELISLRQASAICDLSPTHLRLLVGKGIIWGKKIDAFWVTTQNAIEKYVSQAHKTGPKPKES